MIVLYVTDGAITDMTETVDTIVEASHYPISIIIVGVGEADFSKMEILDSDDAMLQNSAGRLAQRDIVQFVEFKNFKYDTTLLAEEVLREVPNQLVSYMQNKSIAPQPTDFLPVDGMIINK